MAILVSNNQTETNLSGETLLASSSLENSISEARNLSIELDQKSANLKAKFEEIKTETNVTLTQVFAKMDAKETAFAKSINSSATNAVSKIKSAIEQLKEGSETIKNVSKTTSTIITHIVLFVVALALILFLAVPTIKQAKEVLADNKNVLQTAYNLKKENDRLIKENQGLNDELISLNGFVNVIFKDKEKARREYQKWKSSYN